MTDPRPDFFTRFPNPLFDALLIAPMPPVHKDVAFAAVRRTIGDITGPTRPYDAAPLSVSLLASITGHHRTRVSKARQDLIREGVLVEAARATWYNSAVLYVNQDSTKWGVYSVDPAALCWEAAARRRQQSATKQAADGDVLGQQSATKQAAFCCPSESEIEEQSDSSPADDLKGSSGGGLSEEQPATPEQISSIIERDFRKPVRKAARHG